MPAEELLSTRELARRLAVTPETVRRWAQDGRIPVVRASRKALRFAWPEVLSQLEREGARDE